ncbi:MAG: phytoene/squalene synthase family protein [Thermoguttaceae bacterium]
MSRSRSVIDGSYAFCREMARSSGSNFYPSFFLLPKPKRRAMEALYTFLRYTDDLGDGSNPISERRNNLACWRTCLKEAIARSKKTASQNVICHSERSEESAQSSEILRSAQDDTADLPCRQILGTGHLHAAHALRLAIHADGLALLPALVDTVVRFAVPPQHLLAVLDGVEMDLEDRRYETFADLAEYCERVASAVGLACIHIWGFRGDGALELAQKCGIAFQLTNILRDLREDAARGRIYLPLADLRHCGYAPEDLLAGVRNAAFDRVVEMEIDRARRLYRESAELMDWLEPDSRRIFGMMMSVYYRLLERIAQQRHELLERRIELSRCEKFRLAARWILFPPSKAGIGD